MSSRIAHRQMPTSYHNFKKELKMTIINDVPEKELECPNCGGLVDVSGLEGYEIVRCGECGSDFEYVGNELAEID